MPGVVIDPGQAFGTGAHATTTLCLELLLEVADAGPERGPLADLGTGSGVLAIAAAKLGWGPVTGCDSEPAALDAAAENAAANGVELDLARVNLREQAPPRGADGGRQPDRARCSTEVAARIEAPPRRLICSGLLATEIDEVDAALAAAGLEVESVRRRGEWAALLGSGLRPG